jgi:hypothetical protein
LGSGGTGGGAVVVRSRPGTGGSFGGTGDGGGGGSGGAVTARGLPGPLPSEPD